LQDGSTAGTAIITNNSSIGLFGDSTLGSANVTNNSELFFQVHSTAGNSTIHTTAGALTAFLDFTCNGGSAQFITDAHGSVDFSGSAGPSNNNVFTVGSIAGPGSYSLGANHLVVGLNGLPATASGPIEDSGILGGTGASLVKVGDDRLTLSHAGNTYSGGTTIEQGAFEVAAIGAAGTGPIRFESTGKAKATLEIDNAALTGHVFSTNKIDNFGKHDILDLTGLHFHAGATAKYHPTTEVLAVHSGHATDKLTLVSPHGTHFEAASDHHGGTEVFLFFA
jgi:autotransporter-associated beta strand protein